MTDGNLQSVEWYKSSYSDSEGGACVEVGRWRKSSYSDSAGGNCIEVQDGVPNFVPVRDSKDPQGPALAFSREAWSAFVGAVKDGRFEV
jgi:hypothetical protein